MESKNFTVNISLSTIVKTISFLVLLWVLYQLRELVLVILVAVVIASSIEPATRWFVRYKVPRIIAVIIIYLSVVIFLVGVVYFFVPPVINDLSGFSQKLPDYMGSINLFSLEENSFFGSDIIRESLPGGFSLSDALLKFTNYLGKLSSNLIEVVAAVFGGILSLVLIIVFSFYLAVQEKGIDNFLALITPIKHEKYITGLWNRSQRKIGLWFQGQLLLALLIGVLVYLGLTIMGIKYALLLAILAAVFELIPIFGPILAAVPAILVAFFDAGTAKVLMVVLFYVIIQQFENQLIYPLVVKKVIGVPPIISIIALIAGAQLAGFLGIILAIPLASVLMEIFSDIDKEKHSRRVRAGA